MLDGYKRKANMGTVIWLVGMVIIAATVIGTDRNIWEGRNFAAQAVFIVAGGSWFYSLAAYAMAKGHSRWWALAGLLAWLGLLVILLLPDLQKAGLSRPLGDEAQ